MIDLSVEFPQLKDHLYLDHAGASLAPKALLRSWNLEVLENLYGNPHSLNSPASVNTTLRIERTRSRIKRYVYLELSAESYLCRSQLQGDIY